MLSFTVVAAWVTARAAAAAAAAARARHGRCPDCDGQNRESTMIDCEDP
jgi:hypothetical protein